MRPLTVAAFALTLAIVLTACAPQMYQAPGGGLAWGYRALSGSVENLRLVAYYPSKSACDIGRAKDAYNLPKQHAWAGVALGECQPLTVAPGPAVQRGPETEYWAFSFGNYPGVGLGFSTPDFCEMARKGWQGSTPYNAPSACALISLQGLRGGGVAR